MQKTAVINIVALTKNLIGEYTPFLKKWSEKQTVLAVKPVLPAVTCSAQSTYLTGQYPSGHGIVGNGWYSHEECEIKFWKQSNKLVQAKKVWEYGREINQNFTSANICWWYNMYSSVDFSVTPRPQYLADGRKLPDCYTAPADLRPLLQNKLGTFPLFDFWGPKTSIKSSKWIADAAIEVDKLYSPTLNLVYLPHLDYCLQKFGNDFSKIAKDLHEIDKVAEHLITYFEKQGTKVLVVSEYGITDVHQPIALNRILRKHNLISVREERGTELLDAGASKAFAVADHQVAHVYVNDKSQLEKVREILNNTEGIELVLDEEGKKALGIAHERAGDFVVVADEKSWFSYYYWMDDKKAPDFARIVDIHRKPGYDPVEMFINPKIKFPVPLVIWKLIKKTLGFRVLMDIIPLDATLVKGSHGRINVAEENMPVLIGSSIEKNSNIIQPETVFAIIMETLFPGLKLEAIVKNKEQYQTN
ncbi:MAG TPA: alkaline phosphatase family protein [Cytophagaceae bacterium]